jgi:hypothetical protein
LTQKTPARAMRGQVVDVRPTMKTTRGGSRERAEKDWQAKPAGPGSPSAAGAVIDGHAGGEVAQYAPEFGRVDRCPLVVADAPKSGRGQRLDRPRPERFRPT